MADTPRPYTPVSSFHFPENALQQTVEILRAAGRGKLESLLFWAGELKDSQAHVTTLIVPRGTGLYQHALQVRVSDRLVARMCDHIDPPRKVLFGQVHTHKRAAFHSETDDRYSLGTRGYLSAVIPYFAAGDAGFWQEWAFFECIAEGAFRQLLDSEMKARIVVGPLSPISVHYVAE